MEVGGVDHEALLDSRATPKREEPMNQRSSFRILVAALLAGALGPGLTPVAAATVNGPIRVSADGRWLGARYKNAPNVIWVNGGDRVPPGFEDVYRELARGLREGDGGAHPITYHPCGWRSSSQFFHGEDWLAFDMIETWTEWAKVYMGALNVMRLTIPGVRSCPR
jgi:hypothetical protein